MDESNLYAEVLRLLSDNRLNRNVAVADSPYDTVDISHRHSGNIRDAVGDGRICCRGPCKASSLST